MITSRVLGPVEILVNGDHAPPELLWRKNLALLIYLARSPKRTRSRDHLVGLLWGDKPEAAARHSLNEAMRVLRKCTGTEGLESEGGQIRLAGNVVQLDIEVFENCADGEDWSGAAKFVVGEFMEGFSLPGCSAFDDWLHSERVEWRKRSVEVLATRATELMDGGELAEAVTVARRGIALDATSSVAVEAAMRSLAIAGDRAGALSAYETFSERLSQDIAIEPDETLQALAGRIRRERAWRLPEVLAEGGLPGAESRRVPLVGREAELEQLLDAWVSCREDGKAAVAVIEGDPGTGKSRLAEELTARARLDGAAVATARAVPADREEAWSGVLALARGTALDTRGMDEVPAAAAAAFAEYWPNWADRFGDSAGDPERLGRAFVEVAAAVARHQPMFFEVDDAHWLDRESALAVETLVRDLEAAPVFVLVTLAPHPPQPELDELRAHIGREIQGVDLRIGPLGVEALRSLARWSLPGYDEIELDRVTRRIATDSAGLPLLAVELLHAIALGLDLSSASGAWPEPLRTLDQSLPGDLPDAVAAAVRVGFRRLSGEAQRVLATASILGDRVDPQTLERVTGTSVDALAGALDELEWQRWLSADTRGYSFVARVVRGVVARDMLTAGQRQRILEAVEE
jgi:DNA-binding SARP family transcriptional activator